MGITAFKKEISRWRHHLPIRPPNDPLPETLVETLDQTNAAFYPGINVVVKTPPIYPISECAVSWMKRTKTSLGNTVTDL